MRRRRQRQEQQRGQQQPRRLGQARTFRSTRTGAHARDRVSQQTRLSSASRFRIPPLLIDLSSKSLRSVSSCAVAVCPDRGRSPATRACVHRPSTLSAEVGRCEHCGCVAPGGAEVCSRSFQRARGVRSAQTTAARTPLRIRKPEGDRAGWPCGGGRNEGTAIDRGSEPSTQQQSRRALASFGARRARTAEGAAAAARGGRVGGGNTQLTQQHEHERTGQRRKNAKAQESLNRMPLATPLVAQRASASGRRATAADGIRTRRSPRASPCGNRSRSAIPAASHRARFSARSHRPRCKQAQPHQWRMPRPPPPRRSLLAPLF